MRPVRLVNALISFVMLLPFAPMPALAATTTAPPAPQDDYRCDRDVATFWEHGIYNGASWTLYMCHNPGWPYEVWANVPDWFNDQASAICMKSSWHTGWQLTSNLYGDSNRRGFMRSYTVTSNGSGEHCWNFPSWMNDRLSSAGLVWTRP